MADVLEASSQHSFTPKIDSAPLASRATIAAIAVIAYAATSIIHEALGHGGACIITGCVPQLVTNMEFRGDEHLLARSAQNLIAAGGTIANFVAAAIAMPLLRRRRDTPAGPGWFFLWLFATINLLTATGYWLYSGLAGIGDWNEIVRGLSPSLAWHAALAVLGAVTYWTVTRWSMRTLAERLDSSTDARVAAAKRLTLTAYVIGGALEIIAGMFGPGGFFILMISGAAASLGGTSALAWGPQLLRRASFASTRRSPLVIARDRRWIAGGAIVAVLFALTFGAGVALGKGDEGRGIADFNRALEDATFHMDNAATLALWEDTGISLLPSTDPISGKPRIAAFLDRGTRSIPNARMQSFQLQCYDVHVNGDWASEWCTEHQVVLLGDGKTFDGRGKMLLVLHRGGDGKWRLHEEMWNAA